MTKVLIADPFISSHTITPEDEFVVVATDGLWDVMNHKQVVEFVDNWAKTHHAQFDHDAANGAQGSNSHNCAYTPSDCVSAALVTEAVARNSLDNVSVTVLFLQPLAQIVARQQQQQQQQPSNKT